MLQELNGKLLNPTMLPEVNQTPQAKAVVVEEEEDQFGDLPF
jgi:hypothetical protein